MRLEASLNMQQDMRLKLAPQIIQSIEILQLPLLELSNRIDQELLENPLLEVSENAAGHEQEDEHAESAEQEEEDPNAEDAEFDDVENVSEEPEGEESEPLEEENYEALEDMLPSYLQGGGRAGGDGEKDAKLAALENSAAPSVSLEEHLTAQLALFDTDEPIRLICENIIANMDWRGYLEYPLEDILDSIDGPEVSPEQGRQALRIVQQMEPLGVGARDVNECLLLQLDPEGPDYDLLRRLLEDYLDDIVKNRYPKVAKGLDVSIQKLKELVDRIGRLNPIPGALFGETPAPHVIPDVRVELVEGEYRVQLEDTSLPSLRICAYYARKLQQEGLDEKTEEYLRDKLQSARWLIDAIQQRRSTIYNISTAIVEAQKEFFDKGPMHLKPLKMQEIADEVGVHVSTVSRALNGKYMQTPRGIYSMKHFFTGGVEKDNGEMESWEVVRHKLQQVIDEEDKSKPLSDQAIADTLAEQGIDIARRTVSKYRKLLDIPSSRQRKEY